MATRTFIIDVKDTSVKEFKERIQDLIDRGEARIETEDALTVSWTSKEDMEDWASIVEKQGRPPKGFFIQ